MRLIIEPDYEKMSKWAANYVAKCINEAKPTAEKPFKPRLPNRKFAFGNVQRTDRPEQSR